MISVMRVRYLAVSFVCFLLVCSLLAFAQAAKAPGKLVFPAKNGNVTFDHATHVKAEKGDCKVCHDKLFKQDAKAPLNFKAGMHKPAETAKTSCGACHHPGGTAFETKGNCNKCHVKAAAKG
jgi:c(7)-type cytochrome triheme protein